jgi:AraC-like DNA-binding protein
MHLVLCIEGSLRVRLANGRWQRGAGAVTAPDEPHALDAGGAEILLVFLDPESEVGRSLRAVIPEAARVLSTRECAPLLGELDPLAIMQAGGVDFTARAVAALGGASVRATRPTHPRVRRLLRLLRDCGDDDHSLEALARAVGLSPGRLMHVFTESVGIPLRPYLSWLRLQRAAAAVAGGAALSEAAHAAGFADAPHMSRTFRRMFGVSPSGLRPSSRTAKS